MFAYQLIYKLVTFRFSLALLDTLNALTIEPSKRNRTSLLNFVVIMCMSLPYCLHRFNHNTDDDIQHQHYHFIVPVPFSSSQLQVSNWQVVVICRELLEKPTRDYYSCLHKIRKNDFTYSKQTNCAMLGLNDNQECKALFKHMAIHQCQQKKTENSNTFFFSGNLKSV